MITSISAKKKKTTLDKLTDVFNNKKYQQTSNRKCTQTNEVYE